MRRFVLILLCAGCTQFPELDGTISPEVENADYVPFLELEDATQTEPVPTEAVDPLQARAAALSRRADALRNRSVLTPRMQARITDRRNRR